MTDNIIIGGVLLVPAALLVWFGIHMLKKRKRVLAEWLDSEATILELLYSDVKSDDESGMDSFHYKISYTANGEVIETVLKGSDSYKVGSILAVKFNPSDPKKFEVSNNIGGFIGGAVIAFIMAAGIVGYGIYGIICGF